MATLVTAGGTVEVSRVYFKDGHFNIGQGPDVAVKGARIVRCDLDLGRGLKLELTEGYVLTLPINRLAGTYKTSITEE